MEKDILEVIMTRRSVRKFKDRPVDEELLKKVLKAGLLAPSSGNKRPVELVAVKDKETIAGLRECKSFGTAALDTAPVAIVVMADSERSDVWPEDASIASILMQLEAESLGLGSVWLQMRNRQSAFGSSEDDVRRTLSIPDQYGILCILALGYKDEKKEAYTEGDINFSAVHWERFKA